MNQPAYFGNIKAMPKIIKPILIIAAILVVIFLACFGVYNLYEKNYAKKILPGVRVGSINLGNKTADEARSLINQQIDKSNQDGIVFEYANNRAVIYPVVNKSLDADIVDISIDFNADKTIENAIKIGRSGNLIKDAGTRILLLIAGEPIDLVFDANKEKIIDNLKQAFVSIGPADAKYSIQNGQLLILPERAGKKIDYEAGFKKLYNNLKQINFSNIILSDTGIGLPNIEQADCVQMIASAQAIVDLAPITLKYNNNSWPLTQDVLADWIVVSKTNANLSLQLDKNKIANYLEKEIEPKIAEPPLPPKFVFASGHIQETEAPKTGLELNILLAVESLADLPNNRLKQLNLSVSKLLVEDKQINNDFGIIEKIGTASTQIIDSTQKRIYNIKQGSAIINGLLIAPNEEFSLLKFLTPFDETNGYIKELVIQNGVMTPEFGGGLCQLSTTVFRSVINAGLPITERRNHSYWLHYYSPPGTDATIFEPNPDLKFVNDTGKYILINAYVDANLNLTIDLLGTKDGRVATKTEPVVYNVVYPGDYVIYTKALPKGKKSCTVLAYNGADAYFDYKVTYPNGTIKETRFNSHYTPHQGTCYIGL